MIQSSMDCDMNEQYTLPACVVNKIREQFPNPGGELYKGYVYLIINIA